MKDMRVVITGGARGIGKSIVEKYCDLGADVFVLDRENNEVVCNYKNPNYEKLHYYKVDLKDDQKTEKILVDIISKYGYITHLINNVGIYDNAPINEIREDEFIDMMRINVGANLRCTRIVLNKMKQNNYGRIVNIASIAAFHNGINTGAYNACKSAVISITKTLAKETRLYNILVNAVCPGLVDTDMLKTMIEKRAVVCNVSSQSYFQNLLNVCEQQRLIKPEEIANLVEFLGSEANSVVNGAAIPATTGGIII